MIRDLKPDDLPGQTVVAWRKEAWTLVVACIAGALWPPLLITLLIWPPQNWTPGIELDWRIMVMIVGLIALPFGIWRLKVERARTGRPGTRLGVVWRVMLYGGILAAVLQTIMAVLMVAAGAFEAGDVAQAFGASETTVLIFGVGALPVAILVGVSYALWAGLCLAFIAFREAPVVRDRLGLMRSGDAS